MKLVPTQLEVRDRCVLGGTKIALLAQDLDCKTLEHVMINRCTSKTFFGIDFPPDRSHGAAHVFSIRGPPLWGVYGREAGTGEFGASAIGERCLFVLVTAFRILSLWEALRFGQHRMSGSNLPDAYRADLSSLFRKETQLHLFSRIQEVCGSQSIASMEFPALFRPFSFKITSNIRIVQSHVFQSSSISLQEALHCKTNLAALKKEIRQVFSRYSDANKTSGIVWSDKHMYEYLVNPKKSTYI